MPNIIVVGLGGGEKEQLVMGVYERLLTAIEKKETVYLRTKMHPVVKTLESMGLVYESFDEIYEATTHFEDTYETIMTQLITLANEKGTILYAVPGHPMVGESVVQQLLKREDVEVTLAGGKSFIDDLAQAVKIDLCEGFQLVDALDFNVDDLVLTQNVMIMQVFNGFVASEVKLSLMERYPDDYHVALVHGAGTQNEQVEWKQLYEIDRHDGVYNLTTLFVPAMDRDDAIKSFETLQYYMDQVIQKDIWLQNQTQQSLIAYLEEETQEFKDAVALDDIDQMIEELGDVLWEVFFQTSIAEYEGIFTLEDVLSVLNQKIRRRHPHVFDGYPAHTIEEIDAMWQMIKSKEKMEKQDEVR